MPASGKKASWTACMIFEIENNKIITITKEWDKLAMWKQLGWPEEHATCIENLQS